MRAILVLCLVISCAMANGGVRNAPREPVVLRSDKLEVTLDGADAMPYVYQLRSGVRIWGEDAGHPVRATLFRRQPRAFTTVSVKPERVQANPSEAEFFFEAAFEGKPAASFTIRYEVRGAALFVSAEDVREHEGYELIDVAMPNLATVREEDGPAWLAHGDDGGSLVDLRKAKINRLAPNTFWGGVLATLPVVIIGTDRAECVQEVMSFMDTTELAVSGDAPRRRGALGTVKVHRVNGSLQYDMNLDPGKMLASGNEKTLNLLVGQHSLARLDFTGDYDGNGTVEWLDGAKLVGARMPKIPTRYYDDKLLYIVGGMFGPEPAPRTTFPQTLEMVRDLAALTENTPQVAYIGGWTRRGQDADYPAVDQMNEAMGGKEGYRRLVQEARKYNCTVSLDDNYDDAYPSSTAWDPAFIARRPDGELWKSRKWTMESSYIVGLAKYMQGPGLARVDYTAREYGLRNTLLIDVLSYFSVRNDWDPGHPASGVKNLYEGRYRVLDEFAKRGIDVISEALRYAYIGRMSLVATGPTGAQCPFGGQPIPMLPLIYRHSIRWGGGGRDATETVLNTFFYNGRECPWFRYNTDRRDLADFYYTAALPWSKVADRGIESFRREGDRTMIGLGAGSAIEIDWSTRRYLVRVDGVEIARDEATFCPVGDDRIAFYSRRAQELSAPLPKGWNATEVSAKALFTDHKERLPVAVRAGKITVQVPERRPVMVYR